MKWNIDQALTKLEKETGITTLAGTNIGRVWLDKTLVHKHGIMATADEEARGFVKVWCIGLGELDQPKMFCYGRTIRAAYLRLRKQLKPLLAALRKKKPKRTKKAPPKKRKTDE